MRRVMDTPSIESGRNQPGRPKPQRRVSGMNTTAQTAVADTNNVRLGAMSPAL
jgi:hypothetical protein